MDEQPSLPHKIILEDGNRLTVTGVSQVLHLEDGGAVMKTPLGQLCVQGSQLQLKTMSPETNQVVICGRIAQLGYLQTRSRAGFWGRLRK